MQVLVDTPVEISYELASVTADQVIAVLVDQASTHVADVLADTISQFVAHIRRWPPASRPMHAMDEEVADASAVKRRNELTELLTRAESRIAVLEGVEWLSAKQLCIFAGFGFNPPNNFPRQWREEHRIFSIELRGVEHFPSYVLDPTHGYQPFEALAKVIEIFGDTRDGWGLASWFLVANSYLDGRRPQDLLANQPERVIAAAQDEQRGMVHG